jgi:ankyrin repeat protein
VSDWKPGNLKYPPPKAGEPPLHRAARLGDHDAIRSLVESGEAVDALFNIRLDPGAIPEPATALMVAAGSADGATATTVRLLMELGASTDAGPSGKSALSYACEGLGWNYPPGGDAERVRALLAAGADPEVTGYNGRSALARAAGSGDGERVRLLLEAGASPAPDSVESPFQVPLNEAVRSDSLACVRLLLAAGAAVTPDANREIDPVLASARSTGVMSELLAAGADPHAECRFGRSIADTVAANGRASLAERVAMLGRLTNAGVDLDAASPSGGTALARVAMVGDADAVEALLAAGADPRVGRNALGSACFSYSKDRDPRMERTIDLLIAAGLDPNDVDAGGFTPLHAALSADAFGPDYAESDGINVAAAVALIRHGVSINIVYPDTGYRPLHAAAAGRSATLVKLLLDAGADPTERTAAGETPLNIARAADAEQCVRLLEAATSPE